MAFTVQNVPNFNGSICVRRVHICILGKVKSKNTTYPQAKSQSMIK